MADFDLNSAKPAGGGFDLASASPAGSAPSFDLGSASTVSGGSSHITEDPDVWTPENLSKKSTPEMLAMPVTEYWDTFRRQASEGMAATSQAFDEIFKAKTWTSRGGAIFRTVLNGAGTLFSPASAALETTVAGPLEAATQGLLPSDVKFMGMNVTTKAGALDKSLSSQLIQMAFPFAAQKWQTLGQALTAAGTKVLSAGTGISQSSFAVTAKTYLAPGSLGPEAAETASLTSEKWAELARRGDQAKAKLDQFAKIFANAPQAVQLDFIHRVETGAQHLTPQLDQAAKEMRGMLDDRWNEVQAVGKHINYIQDYFPHFWKDKGNAFGSANARSPLLGSQEFMRARRLPTMADGIAAGLEPVTTNPIDLTLLKLRSMDRLIVGSKLVDEMKGAGLVQFVKSGTPPPKGFTEILDPIGTVKYMNNQGQMVLAGRYMAPENAARVLNNHLSVSDIGRKDPIQWARMAGNLLNMSQLSFSAFHGGFVTMDSITSKTSLAIQQLSRGEITEGLKNSVEAAFAPVAVVRTFRKGTALRDAWLNPGGATPELQKMADAMQAGGGRISMPALYQATPAGSFVNAWKNGTIRKEIREAFKDHPLKAPFELGIRALETTNSWLMEWYVPRQKLGVAYDMIADAIRRNPAMSASDLRDTMQGIWASVDNRMGQLVYDNLFWNKTLRDSMHLGIRAVGWNLGTIREFGGGAVDAVKDLANAGKGNWDGLSRRTAYILATTATTAATAAVIQHLYTGKGPQTGRDYFFPRTGAKDPKYGYDERISLPTYVKDLEQYNQSVGGTLLSKVHPLWGDAYQLWNNRDFFGAAIVGPERPGHDLWVYLRDQYTPFIARRAAKKRQPAGPYGKLEQFFGIQRAPLAVASPETQEALNRKYDEIPALKKKAKEEARGDR